jgi:hypothetical protein
MTEIVAGNNSRVKFLLKVNVRKILLAKQTTIHRIQMKSFCFT